MLYYRNSCALLDSLVARKKKFGCNTSINVGTLGVEFLGNGPLVTWSNIWFSVWNSRFLWEKTCMTWRKHQHWCWIRLISGYHDALLWQIISYHVASSSVQNLDTESFIDFRSEVTLQVFIVMGVGPRTWCRFGLFTRHRLCFAYNMKK
jgi:hypothetical protein